VEEYTRRNPGKFLLAAAALGVIAGRMAKNAGGSTGTMSSRASDADGFSGRRPVAPGMRGTSPLTPPVSAPGDVPAIPLTGSTRAVAGGGLASEEARPRPGAEAGSW